MVTPGSRRRGTQGTQRILLVRNDFIEYGYGGPSLLEGSRGYRFKLVALDSELGVPKETRKTRVGSAIGVGSAIAMNAEVLAATQIIGEYDADQGTAF